MLAVQAELVHGEADVDPKGGPLMFNWLANLLNLGAQRQATLEQGFPRVLLHEGCDGRGWPLVRSDGTLDWEVAGSIARWGRWCFSPTDLYDSRRDAVRAVQSMHPGMVLWAHVLGPRYWAVSAPVGWAGRLAASIGGNYCKHMDGSPWQGPSNVYASIDLPVVQGALVAAYSELLDSGVYAGLMIDWMGYSDTWIYSGDPTLDLNPWGGDVNAWDAAMRAGKGELLRALRAKYPAAVITCNGGPRGWYSGGELANGWWRENFPNQGGATWAANVTGPDGLIADAGFYRDPQASVLCVACNPLDTRAAMFGLASSCMGDGWLVVGPSDFDPKVPYRTWWMPAYANPGLGWMGKPLGAAYQNQSGQWVREFEHGWASVNPAQGSGALTAK